MAPERSAPRPKAVPRARACQPFARAAKGDRCQPDPYIDVAVALPVDGTYTYAVPPNLMPLAESGRRVLVPFGRRNVTGYILGSGRNHDSAKIKRILDILDEKPLFQASMIPFFKWIAGYYLHPLGEVIRTALPGGLNIYDMTVVSLTPAGRQALQTSAASPIEEKVLRHLARGPCRLKDLNRQTRQAVPGAVLFSLERCGWIERVRKLKGGRIRPKTERFISLVRPDIPEDRFFEIRKPIITALETHDPLSVTALNAMVPGAAGRLPFLARSGYIAIENRQVYRDPFGDPVQPDRPPSLTPAQAQVVAAVRPFIGKAFAAYLLAGVTGSGKTEVYMRLAAEVIRTGLTVLVLVPEIALISQTERRFRSRFGECVAVLHSGLSAGERYDQWVKIAERKAAIVIGARSAIFAPLHAIGLIIVDEEHDDSYKQDGGLRYNARDVAVVRAKLAGAVILLGSATPSIQALYNVTTRKFKRVSLTERIEQMPLPRVELVDLRETRDSRGMGKYLTPQLLSAIRETLDHGEQVLVFLNRRGFANFPVCAACGKSIRCRNCDITLTLHQQANAFKCHYCGFTLPASSGCPSCGASKIKLLGLGTEKVEAALASLFPAARIARMDRDTTVRKGSILKILKGLKNRNIDILVGTQMVAKGHDFPGITLVGIICADLSLSFPDFRAGERTFQLLTQVAGRAGRGTVPGRVILQTYNPGHFSILSAINHDVDTFYNTEIKFREALKYPPYARLIQLKVAGRDKKTTRRLAGTLGSLCSALTRDAQHDFTSIEVLGPIEAPISRIARYHRWQILLRHSNVRLLQKFVKTLYKDNKNVLNCPEIRTTVDVDPVFML